jgi:Na+/proline symporter
MEHAEVPLEQPQEAIAHHAEHATEKWILGVALTAALLAVLAAVTALLAEHHANEAMLDEIHSADKWAFYQAKSIKANLFTTKIELLKAFDKPVDDKDLVKVETYRKEQEAVREEAEEKERESAAHMRRHAILSRSVTLFQVGIAVGAISVLTRRKSFWWASLVFGAVGMAQLFWGTLIGG